MRNDKDEPNTASATFFVQTVLVVVLFLTGLALVNGRALANGGTFEVFRGTDGPYEISVGVLPEDMAVGTVHFSVSLTDLQRSVPVTDAKVVLIASDESGEPIYEARAVNTPISPLYYDANITFQSAGQWTIRVDVDSGELGPASVNVALEVTEPSLTPGIAGSILFLAVTVVLVGGGLYVWRSSKRSLRSGVS
ncbi:MAG: hypothetical protein O3A47_05025 [Chloroflexi bacterium]|nr:hypothetical protein [Chloroflexota bacterium]